MPPRFVGTRRQRFNFHAWPIVHFLAYLNINNARIALAMVRNVTSGDTHSSPISFDAMLLHSEGCEIEIDFVRPNKRQGMPCLYKFIAVTRTLSADGFDHSDNVNAPKAYLNILLFDKNFNFVDAAYKQIGIDDIQTKAETDAGIKADHGYLNRSIIVPEAGYAYIFLSNENTTQVDVYFDDLTLIHAKSPVIQMDDYYPFGLTFNSYQRENSVDQRWKFQGQEHIDDLELNWDAFKWRNHQPDIGRFFNIDPLADKYVYNSPYAFSENKVTNHIELEGLEAYSAQQALNREIKKVENVVMSGVNTVKQGVGKAINWVVGVANFTDNLPRERSSQQSGAGVDIFDTKAGADNKYAPLPDPNGKNMMVDKAVVDAMGAVTEATKPPSPTDLGEKVQVVAEAMDKGAGAGQAAKEVINMDNVVTETGQVTSIPVNKVNDTTEHKNFTFYNITTQSGQDSVIQTTNEEKKKQ